MKKILVILLIPILCLTGCWNYRELNYMAIVGAVGVDYDDEGQMFIVSVQVFNAKKSSNSDTSTSSQSSPITYYEQKAKTIHEALRNVIEESPKRLYIGHLDLIILGESIAKKYLMESLDFFFRDAESRKDFVVFSTKDCDASDVLKILTPLETTPSRSITQSLITNFQYKSTTLSITYDRALSSIYKEGEELILPIIKIKGDIESGEDVENSSKTASRTRLLLDGAAVFKEEQLIGYLDGQEVVGFNFIYNQLKESIVSFKCDDEGNYASIEIMKTKTKSGVKVDKKNNQIKAIIEVNGNVGLSEINCNIDLKDNNNILQLENKANKEVEKIINATLEKVMKTYKSDIFGFGNNIYKNYYSYWNKIKDDWNDLFPKVHTEVKSTLKITNKGSTTNSTKGG